MKIFKKHVSPRDLWVRSDEKLSDFYASSWQRGESAVPLLVVRGALLTAVVAVMAWSLVLNSGGGPSPYWLIYLTNWGLLLNCCLMLSGFIVSCVATFTKLPEFELTPWYISVYWLFNNISIAIAFLITVLYWTLLFNPEHEVRSLPLFWLDVSTHGFNSLLCLVELTAARTPVRALHFYQSLATGLWYTAFTGIYYAAGGLDSNGNPYIYPVLNWNEAGKVVVIIVVSIIGLLLIWAVIYLIAMARDKISRKYIRHIGHDLPK